MDKNEKLLALCFRVKLFPLTAIFFYKSDPYSQKLLIVLITFLRSSANSVGYLQRNIQGNI